MSDDMVGEEKKAPYFTTKNIVHMAIMGAVMLLASGATVPLVIGIPFPGIRTIACGFFFGIAIALTYGKVPRVGAGTFTCTVCSLPMVFISPVIPVFTIAAGMCTDVYFALVRKRLTTLTTVGLGAVLMGTMMIIGTALGVLFIRETTFTALFMNPVALLVGFVGSTVLGAFGAWVATRIFKEFKTVDVYE